MSAGGPLNVTLFCGGRGSFAVIREFLRQPNVNLNLLVNAYDDGLSTGELRHFIPGMLGPSDLRKNLSYMLELHSPRQYVLAQLLEYRLPEAFDESVARSLQSYLRDRSAAIHPAATRVREWIEQLDPGVAERLRDYLTAFLDYETEQSASFRFADCSLGNLLFAGAYLRNERSFIAAADEVAKVFTPHPQAHLINVTNGENRFLVALKEDGEFLVDEATLVGEQNTKRITDLFFLEEPAGPQLVAALEGLDLEGRRRVLRDHHRDVTISEPARRALLEADVIVFGSGTQHSSLLPSYMTKGLPESVRQSGASTRCFVANISRDHDIQSLDVTDLVDGALAYLGDPENQRRFVTHLLYSDRDEDRPDRVRLDRDKLTEGAYKGIRIVGGDLENPVQRGIHSGTNAVKAILDLHDQESQPHPVELDIYLDLNKRSLGINAVLQEFLELPWHQRFEKTRLHLNNVELPDIALPENLEVRAANLTGAFTEVEFFNRWLAEEPSAYLCTITGDGEYRMRDILIALDVMRSASFGALFGSRIQSRKQFLDSIESAYGESKPLYFASWFAAFVYTAIFSLRTRMIFTDPFTGFRVFRRSSLSRLKGRGAASSASASALTKRLLNAGIEVAEVPVHYRTFAGFTNVRWRLLRGLRNVWGAIR